MTQDLQRNAAETAETIAGFDKSGSGGEDKADLARRLSKLLFTAFVLAEQHEWT